MSKGLVAAWEELRWGQSSRVISDPASLHGVNIGSICEIETHNHSWNIRQLHAGCFHLWSNNNLHAAPPFPTPPPGLWGWPCPWAMAPSTSPAAVALSRGYPLLLFLPLWLGTFTLLWALPAGVLWSWFPSLIAVQANTEALLQPSPVGLIQGLQMPFRSLILNT